MPKRTIPFLIVIGLLGLPWSFTINILDPFIYTEKVNLLAPLNLKNTVLGFITIMGLIVALIVQPIMGRISDRTRSPWGKRIPYLAIGVIGICCCLVFIVAAESLGLLIMAVMLASAFANTMQGPWQALIPDRVPEEQRGLATGIKTLLELTGAVAGLVVIERTLSRRDLWTAPWIALTLFVVFLLATLYTLNQSSGKNEPVTSNEARPHFSWSALKLSQAPALPWWMLNRFLFWSSAIALRTFMLNYVQDVHGLSLAEAEALGSRVLLVLGAGVFLLALPAGVMADRIGRRPLLIIAGFLAAGGAAFFVFLRDLNMIFVAGGLIALGGGIFVSVSWAFATDLAPKTEGALYLGLANAATVVGSIGGRLGGPLIDGLNQVTNTLTIGYWVVFAIAALFFAGSSLAVLKIPEYRTSARNDL